MTWTDDDIKKLRQRIKDADVRGGPPYRLKAGEMKALIVADYGSMEAYMEEIIKLHAAFVKKFGPGFSLLGDG